MAMDMSPVHHEVRADVHVELVESAAEMVHQPMRESWAGFEPMQIEAYAGGRRVGCLGWAIIPYVAERLGASSMNIWDLEVDKEFRRKKIASALMSRAMRRSYALGARFASVGTLLNNTPAQTTYAKFGFEPYVVLVGRECNLNPKT